MVVSSELRWILTVAFTLPALHGAWRAIRTRTGFAGRVDHVLHSSMGVCMVAMIWPWGMDWPALPQTVLFSLGGLWFLAAAPFRAGDRSPGKAALAVWPRVVMMGAMTWMVAAMGSGHALSGHGEPVGTHDIQEMGTAGAAAMSTTGTGLRAGAALLAGVLAVIGLIWLARTLAPATRKPTAGDWAGTDSASSDPSTPRAEGPVTHACHATMALGMAVTFVLLV